MNAAELRAQINNKLEKVEDERFLKVVHSMLDTYVQEQEEEDFDHVIESIPPSPDWKPMTEEAFMARLEESSAQFDKGEYLTIEELEKDMEQW